MTRRAWTALRDDIVARLGAVLPVDGVFLALHGAMLAEGEDDPEGALLSAIRDMVGPQVPIAATLDLHAHVTDEMADVADIIVGFRLYPHLDIEETGERAAELLLRSISGEIQPVVALSKLAMLTPVTGQCTDPGCGPMAALRAEADALARLPPHLCASLFPVQPWLDLPSSGYAAVVVADKTRDIAQAAADRLCRSAWQRRRDFDHKIWTPREAVAQVGADGRMQHLLVDAADCVGGGAGGGSAAVLDALLRYGPDLPSAVLLRDPATVERARAVGVGNRDRFTIGGAADGEAATIPVDAEVRRLFDGIFSYKIGPRAGATGKLGPSALLLAGTVRIVVTTHGAYEVGDEQYAAAGVDCSQLRCVAVKNPMNFRTGFPGRAADYVVSTPGETSPDLRNLPWRNKTRPFFPLDDAEEPLFLPRQQRRDGALVVNKPTERQGA